MKYFKGKYAQRHDTTRVASVLFSKPEQRIVLPAQNTMQRSLRVAEMNTFMNGRQECKWNGVYTLYARCPREAMIYDRRETSDNSRKP